MRVKLAAALVALALSVAVPAAISAQAAAPGDPGRSAVSADEGIRSKFDPGFYEKVQLLAGGAAHGGGENGTRYYDVVIIVGRDASPDDGNVAKINKAELAERLELLGATGIVQGELLSFVIASVPVDAINYISTLAEVYRIGDGEMEVTSFINRAKMVTNSTPARIIAAAGTELDGSGVLVGIIDGTHTPVSPNIFGDRVVGRYTCGQTCVEIGDPMSSGHGFLVSQVVGSSHVDHPGVAPGVSLISFHPTTFPAWGLAMERAVLEGADVVGMMLGIARAWCNPTSTLWLDLLINETVENGAVFVSATGNSAGSGGRVPNTIPGPSCAHNTITVGGLSLSPKERLYGPSGRGPTGAPVPQLKPELVAVAHPITLINDPLISQPGAPTHVAGGTSMAGPMVMGSSALLIQADPHLTPLDVKAYLMLGARYTGPDDCTSKRYETTDDEDDLCSMSGRTTATFRDHDPLETRTLNNVGLGVLNVEQSLRYLYAGSHLAASSVDSTSATREYQFEVTDTTKQVKIVMVWLAHHEGTTSNMDFVTRDPDGTVVAEGSGDSGSQLFEFTVFTPDRAGTYTVTVSAPGLSDAVDEERFVLGSTMQLSRDGALVTSTVPKIQLSGNNTVFESGTEPPGAECLDAEDGRFEAARVDPPGFEMGGGNFTFEKRQIPYEFTYVCTDSAGRMNQTNGMHTQVSDVPHLQIPGITHDDAGKQEFSTLTFHRSGNLPSFDDAWCYHHSTGQFRNDASKIAITGEDDEGNAVENKNNKLHNSIKDNLGWHLITHTCTIDGKSNAISQTVYTTARDQPVINTNVGSGEAVHPLGDAFEHPASCASVFDEALPVPDPDILDEAMMTVAMIDGSTPLGTYTATYSCTQDLAENANHLGGSFTAAQKSLVINVIERTKPLLTVPAGRIVHEFGTALDLAGIGVTCTDNVGTPDLDYEPKVTATTAVGTVDVTITCEDGSENVVDREIEVVVRDMQVPVVTLLGDPVITSEGHLFRDPGASCEDPQDGRLEATSTIRRHGRPGVVPIADPGRYVIEYNCTDSDSNAAEPATRDVYIGRIGDALEPVISINGFSTIRMAIGGIYDDDGAVCTDANYGDLPVVVREDVVDSARAGSYEVTYTCTDGTFTATAVRTVIVVAEVPEDTMAPVIETDGPFSGYASEASGSMQTAGPIGVHPPPARAAAGPTGMIGPSGNATFVPPPGPGGAASSHDTERLPHRQGTEFVPPILWCVDGTDGGGVDIRTASNSTHGITPSTAAGPEDVTYTCKDAAGNEAPEVTLRVQVEEGPPPVAALMGSRTVMMAPGQVYEEEGAACDDGRFERPDRELLPVVRPDSDDPSEFSKPGRYEINYACEAAGAMSGIITRIIIVGGSRSAEEDWRLNPTFGVSWVDNTQAVTGGFSFDGRHVDVTDNFHAHFARIDAAVGEEHVITAKIHSEQDLERFTIYLGVPDVSRATDAEAEIAVDVAPDGASEPWYLITGTSHVQEDPLVDAGYTRAELRSEACRPGSDVTCLEVEVRFRVMAPLSSDIMAISAMDTERRVTVTYVNDGVTFTGGQLFPPAEASFVTRAGNQHPAEWIRLVQPDRRYNVWEDQHGFAWLQNQYGSWIRLTHAGFERLADPAVSIVTRHHDSFADLLRAEQERAALVFDASELEREVGESFSHDAPVRAERLRDPAILERLHVSELAALEYLVARP